MGHFLVADNHLSTLVQQSTHIAQFPSAFKVDHLSITCNVHNDIKVVDRKGKS